MKTLIVQLANHSNVLRTLPTVAAIKRNQQDSQVDLLVFEKYKDLVLLSSQVDEVQTINVLDTVDLEAPEIEGDSLPERELLKIHSFLENLKLKNYDRVINLSFTSLSSFVVNALGVDNTVGFTRHSDGFLNLPDDMSAYYYAQTMHCHTNRIHLVDIFCSMAGYKLDEEDLCLEKLNLESDFESPRIVIEIKEMGLDHGLSRTKWQQVISKLAIRNPKAHIYVCGSVEDLSNIYVSENINSVQKVEVCGSDRQFFKLVFGAKLVVSSCDYIMQIATSLSVPALYVSVSSSSFWEKGPLSKNSCVLAVENEDDISSDEIVDVADSILYNKPNGMGYHLNLEGSLCRYVSKKTQPIDVSWQITKTLYVDGQFLKTTDPLFKNGLLKLKGAADMAAEQLVFLKKGHLQPNVAMDLLDQVDIIFTKVGDYVPSLKPVVAWFFTERIRFGPAAYSDILEQTHQLFVQFQNILSNFLINHLDANPERVNPEGI